MRKTLNTPGENNSVYIWMWMKLSWKEFRVFMPLNLYKCGSLCLDAFPCLCFPLILRGGLNCVNLVKLELYLPEGFPGGSVVENPPANAGDVGSIPGLGRSPGEGNGNPPQHSYLKNPSTEEPGGLQSMGSQRAMHDLATKTTTNIFQNSHSIFGFGLSQPKEEPLWYLETEMKRQLLLSKVFCV